MLTLSSLVISSATVLFFLKIQILNHIKRITKTLHAISHGELDVQLPPLKSRKDEIGIIDDTMHVFKKSIMETKSVQYARMIQESLLPRKNILLANPMIKNCDILWKPKNVVGGDLYWCQETDDGLLLAIIDCTGHGVPGAFISILLSSIFDRVVKFKGITRPDLVMMEVNQAVKIQLNQMESSTSLISATSDEGCDCSVLLFPSDGSNKIYFSGANSIAFLLKPDESPHIITGSSMGCGYSHVPYDYEYALETFTTNEGDRLIIMTDGILDQQTGGEMSVSFGRKRLLDAHSFDHPIDTYTKNVYNAVVSHMAKTTQRDDFTMVNLEICASSADSSTSKPH